LAAPGATTAIELATTARPRLHVRAWQIEGGAPPRSRQTSHIREGRIQRIALIRLYLETLVIDFASLAILGAAITAPFLFVRLVSRGEPFDVLRLFAGPAEMPWPRGVQEEEPRPWRWNARPWQSAHAGSRSFDDRIDAAGDGLPDAA
jgi:hypothetical protein